MYSSIHFSFSSDGNLEVATPPSTSSGEKISSGMFDCEMRNEEVVCVMEFHPFYCRIMMNDV